MYRYFFSTNLSANVPWRTVTLLHTGTVRPPATASKTTVHLYPFVNDKVVSINQNNHDVDHATILNVFITNKNAGLEP